MHLIWYYFEEVWWIPQDFLRSRSVVELLELRKWLKLQDSVNFFHDKESYIWKWYIQFHFFIKCFQSLFLKIDDMFMIFWTYSNVLANFIWNRAFLPKWRSLPYLSKLRIHKWCSNATQFCACLPNRFSILFRMTSKFDSFSKQLSSKLRFMC